MSSPIERFVARRNIANFRRDLEGDVNSARRTMLLKLLIEQEDLLGRTREQYDEINRYIARAKAIIRAQLETIALLKANGQPMDEAERRLCELLDLLIAHEWQRSKIVSAVCSR